MIHDLTELKHTLDETALRASRISEFISKIRESLLSRRFQEVILPIHPLFDVNSPEVVRSSEGQQLRYSTEPDVWLLASSASAFFTIADLYRVENTWSDTRLPSFRVIDVYNENSLQTAIDELFSVIEEAATKLDLPSFKDLPIISITYAAFHSGQLPPEPFPRLVWVTDYPKEEAYFDQSSGQNSTKQELFYCDEQVQIELGAAGAVGRICGDLKLAHPKLADRLVADKTVFGVGIGAERLFYVIGLLARHLGRV